jgi:hypothetical protein
MGAFCTHFFKMNYLFSSDLNRSSDDGQDNRDYLHGLLLNGTITITDVLVFFNYACGAYKEASRVIGSSDARINIEFNYAARAMASYIAAVDDDEKKLALLDAFQASRHIINDSLDLILGELERHLRNAVYINLDITISDYIDGFETLYHKKEEIHAIVSESRRKRGKFRYQAYLELIDGEPYKNLILFLEKINQALFKLGSNQKEVRKKNRRDLWIIIASTTLAIFGFLGILFPKNFESYGDKIKTVIPFTENKTPTEHIPTLPKNP